jgi:hypothetical protein
MYKMAKTRINDLEIENIHLKSELLDRPEMRDHFAMSALNGILTAIGASFDPHQFRIYALWAYEIADAMLAERDDSKKN